jgi:hypothetical protein
VTVVLYHNTVGALRHGREVWRGDEGSAVDALDWYVPESRIYARVESLGPEAERFYYEHRLSDCALCAECDAALDRMLARVA